MAINQIGLWWQNENKICSFIILTLLSFIILTLIQVGGFYNNIRKYNYYQLLLTPPPILNLSKFQKILILKKNMFYMYLIFGRNRSNTNKCALKIPKLSLKGFRNTTKKHITSGLSTLADPRPTHPYPQIVDISVFFFFNWVGPLIRPSHGIDALAYLCVCLSPFTHKSSSPIIQI